MEIKSIVFPLKKKNKKKINKIKYLKGNIKKLSSLKKYSKKKLLIMW